MPQQQLINRNPDVHVVGVGVHVGLELRAHLGAHSLEAVPGELPRRPREELAARGRLERVALAVLKRVGDVAHLPLGAPNNRHHCRQLDARRVLAQLQHAHRQPRPRRRRKVSNGDHERKRPRPLRSLRGVHIGAEVQQLHQQIAVAVAHGPADEVGLDGPGRAVHYADWRVAEALALEQQVFDDLDVANLSPPAPPPPPASPQSK